MSVRIGRGTSRAEVHRALQRARPGMITYEDVLEAEDIREALHGALQALDEGTRGPAAPLLAWLAAHRNAPEDVLRALAEHGGREVLLSLAGNRALPEDLRRSLLAHEDDEVRTWANHVYCRMRTQ